MYIYLAKLQFTATYGIPNGNTNEWEMWVLLYSSDSSCSENIQRCWPNGLSQLQNRLEAPLNGTLLLFFSIQCEFLFHIPGGIHLIIIENDDMDIFGRVNLVRRCYIRLEEYLFKKNETIRWEMITIHVDVDYFD